MRKGLYLVLSLVMVFSLGAVFLHCGDDDGGCKEGEDCCAKDTTCPTGEECNLTNNTCEPICCPDAPAGEYHISIAGKAMHLHDRSDAGSIMVAPISPMDALTNPNPTPLDTQVTAANGIFQTECFDVTQVGLGIIMLADDNPIDGPAGTYYPISTGVIGWDTNEEKVCVNDAAVMALVNDPIVNGIGMLPDIDPATEGFAMGIVVDAAGDPVPGATVTLANGDPLTKVYYPSADFTDLTTGTETSAVGLFILPASNFTTITDITAQKTGMTFEVMKAAAPDGLCYFTPIPEAE